MLSDRQGGTVPTWDDEHRARKVQAVSLGCNEYVERVLKSDQEPSILALKQAVNTASGMEIKVEESPVGDRRANGQIETQLTTSEDNSES